jgi:hypothetical protein
MRDGRCTESADVGRRGFQELFSSLSGFDQEVLSK